MVISPKLAVMKNVSVYLALLTLVLMWACAKDSVETPTETVIRLNISVASPDGADSKAAKTAWEAGDQINFWFDAIGVDQTVPDLVATYDGSTWTSGPLRDGCSLLPSGRLLALYESHNDLSSPMYSYQWEDAKEWFYPQASLTSTDYRCMPLVLSCGNIPYTYAESTLTASLDSWIYQTRFKVLVKNDDAALILSAESYVLQVQNLTAESYPAVSSAWQVVPGVSVPAIGMAGGNAVGKAAGVQEADGIAFYYNSFSASSADILFTLSVYGDADYVYGVKGKNLDATGNKCTGVALKHSSFGPKGNIDSVSVEDWGLLN